MSNIKFSDEVLAAADELAVSFAPSNRFPEGKFRVAITDVELVEPEDSNKNPYFKLSITDGEREDTALKSLSPKAMQYTVSFFKGVIRQGLDESDYKAKTDGITDSDSLLNAIKRHIIAPKKQCWLSVTKGDRTYTDRQGNRRISLEKELTFWEPKSTAGDTVKELVKEFKTAGASQADPSEIPF